MVKSKGKSKAPAATVTPKVPTSAKGKPRARATGAPSPSSAIKPVFDDLDVAEAEDDDDESWDDEEDDEDDSEDFATADELEALGLEADSDLDSDAEDALEGSDDSSGSDGDGITDSAMRKLISLVDPSDIPEGEMEALAALQEQAEEDDDDDHDDEEDEELADANGEVTLTNGHADEEEMDGIEYEDLPVGSDDEDIGATIKRRVITNDEVRCPNLRLSLALTPDIGIAVGTGAAAGVAQALVGARARLLRDSDIDPRRSVGCPGRPRRHLARSRTVSFMPFALRWKLSSRCLMSRSYKVALSAASRAQALFASASKPFFRPADYFAEMVKSDAQMEKIRSHLLDEQAGLKASEEARRQRGLKKFGKAVQVQKRLDREKEAKRVKDGVNELRKSALLSSPVWRDSLFIKDFVQSAKVVLCRPPTRTSSTLHSTTRSKTPDHPSVAASTAVAVAVVVADEAVEGTPVCHGRPGTPSSVDRDRPEPVDGPRRTRGRARDRSPGSADEGTASPEVADEEREEREEAGSLREDRRDGRARASAPREDDRLLVRSSLALAVAPHRPWRAPSRSFWLARQGRRHWARRIPIRSREKEGSIVRSAAGLKMGRVRWWCRRVRRGRRADRKEWRRWLQEEVALFAPSCAFVPPQEFRGPSYLTAPYQRQTLAWSIQHGRCLAMHSSTPCRRRGVVVRLQPGQYYKSQSICVCHPDFPSHEVRLGSPTWTGDGLDLHRRASSRSWQSHPRIAPAECDRARRSLDGMLVLGDRERVGVKRNPRREASFRLR